MRLRHVIALLLALGCGGKQSSSTTPPAQPQATTGSGNTNQGTTVPTLPDCSGTVSAGNTCCSDGTVRPSCDVAAQHIGYWQLDCAAPHTNLTCTGGTHTESVTLPAGQLTVVYTTGTFHDLPGEVAVTLDGTPIGVSKAALPGGTVNSPLPAVAITAGTHELQLVFTADSPLPAGKELSSWGGFLDLYVQEAKPGGGGGKGARPQGARVWR